MKTKFLTKIIITLCSVIVFNSCSNDDNDMITSADMVEIKAIIGSGQWKITYYVDSGKEETNDYNGYSFTFNTDGTLNSTNGSTSVAGSWSLTSDHDSDDDSSDDDSSDDDSSDDDIEFNVFFTEPDLLETLSDDWDIQKYTSSRIELIDDDREDPGKTDYLTFEKI